MVTGRFKLPIRSRAKNCSRTLPACKDRLIDLPIWNKAGPRAVLTESAGLSKIQGVNVH